MKMHYALMLLPAVILSGCASAQYHRDQVSGDDKSTISIANVQRNIKVGMSSAQVVEVLGSPSMVTTDENRNETWVYDKVSSEAAVSNGHNGIWSGFAGAASSSQKTLTIIIKFDGQNRVRDFSYRQSKF